MGIMIFAWDRSWYPLVALFDRVIRDLCTNPCFVCLTTVVRANPCTIDEVETGRPPDPDTGQEGRGGVPYEYGLPNWRLV